MQKRPKVGTAVFVWRDGQFVVHQRKGSHGDGTWSVPGGHLEFGESWAQCAAREVMEETGMKIANVRPLAFTNDIMQAEGKHYITIWLEADWLAGEPVSREPEKVVSIRWATFKTLPAPLFEPCWQNLRTAKPELFI